jgi:ATP/maltotriose-dependent transcriptional regulator MalT
VIQNDPYEEQVAPVRAAFARGDWRAARSGYEAVRSTTTPASPTDDPLEVDDLDRAGRAAWFLGDVTTSLSESEHLYQRLLADGRDADGAHLAVRLALAWVTRGDIAVGSAWLARARRLLRSLPTSPTHGYLAYVEAAVSLEADGDPAPPLEAAGVVERLARRFEDPALGCFTHVLRGLGQVRGGRVAEGFEELEEAMLPVVAGQVEPLWSGDIYCTVIHLAEELGDLTRMRDWTDALERWAMPISTTFMYAGVTRVHQLQIIAAEGGWDVVEAELGGLSADLVGAHGWLAGAGYLELGDVRRLRGDLDGAGEAYTRAEQLGMLAEPGRALLQRAAGDVDGALARLRAGMAESGDLAASRLLLPAVVMALEGHELGAARDFAKRLDETADRYGTPGLRARANEAHGAIALATGHPDEALTRLDAAAATYRAQRHRYAIARVHEALGRAHRDLGDGARAAAARATATSIYRSLGAQPDLDRLAPQVNPAGLTEREVEVLAHVAGGASNRSVAGTLFISDKTVSRHLANIFAKTGVSSRTAAAAWARAHGISPHGPA